MTALAPRVGFSDADDRGGASWDDVVRFEQLERLTARPIVREIEVR